MSNYLLRLVIPEIQKAVKPSTDIEELLGDIHAGLRDLHFRVLELERSTKVESKA